MIKIICVGKIKEKYLRDAIEEYQKRLRELNGITTITTKWTQTNKSVRIQTNAGWVKSHVLFRDTTVQNKEYRLAMNQLVGYTMSGKAKHDDSFRISYLLWRFLYLQQHPIN